MVISSQVMGQKTFQPKVNQFDWQGIIYRKETAFEIRLHTNGALIGVNLGKIKTYYKTNYYHLSLGYLRDPREKRQNRNLSFSLNDRSKSFTFGKQNSIINLRGGIGVRRYLSEKARRRGIAVGYDFMFGPSLAILKPSYVEQIVTTDSNGATIRTTKSIKYTDETAEVFTSFNDIYGGSGYFTGFGELSVVPGLQGKIGLFFSLGAFDKVVKSVEVGMMGDLFVKKIPIMVETDEVSNKPYFLNFYVNFTFGKRTN